MKNRNGTIRKSTLTLIFIVYTMFAVVGQTSGLMVPDYFTQDSTIAARLFEQARNSFELDSLDLAFGLAAESLRSAMRSNHEDIEIACLFLIAEIYGSMGSPGMLYPII